MKKALRNFFNNEVFIMLLTLLTTSIWFFRIDYHITLIIYALLILGVSLTCRDSKAFIPIILSITMANIFGFKLGATDVSETVKEINFTYVIVIGVIIFLSVLYFFIKNKQKNEKLSLIGLSLIGLFISFMLTDIFVKKSINFLLIGLLVLLFYFIKHTTDYYRYKDEVLPYLSKTMFYASLTIAIEIILYYILFFELSSTKQCVPNLGWATHNSASLLLLLTMPIGAFTIIKTKSPYYFIGLLFAIGANLLTTSRGGILAMGLEIILLIILFYKKLDKKDFVIGFIISLLCFGIIFLLFLPSLNKILGALFHDGLNNNGRFDLWKKGWEAFTNSPILGGGTFLFPENNVVWQGWYHSTVIDILGQLGIVGAIFFGIHFITKYISLIKKHTTFKWCVLIGLLVMGGYALIDVAYFTFPILIFYFINLGFIEK